MKILCVSYEFPPLGGGGAPVCERLCRALHRAGHHVDVLTSHMRGLPEFDQQDGVNIYRAKCIRLHKHYTTAPELATTLLPSFLLGRKLMRDTAYDLIHCHFILPSGIVAAALSKQTGVPYVLTAHGSDIPGYNPDRFASLHTLLRPIWRKVVAGSAAVTAPSDFLGQLLRRYIDVPVEKIPNPFEREMSSSVRPANRILAVSRIFERKGLQHLIAAYDRLDTDWELTIAGDGPYLDTIRAQSDALGSDVSFLGFVSGDRLFDLYSSSKIFVMPSSRENFPVVLLEALTAGCAVITTSGSGCEEVVGDAGLLVPPEDPAALAEAIQSLIEDDDARNRLGAAAKERAREFGDHSVAGQFQALFQRVLSGVQTSVTPGP